MGNFYSFDLQASGRTPGSDSAAHGSILSWEQLALARETLKMLGDDDLQVKLADDPASSFLSTTWSLEPTRPMVILQPHRPFKFPWYLPSPAHCGLQQSRFIAFPDTSGDYGTATMLHLQLQLHHMQHWLLVNNLYKARRPSCGQRKTHLIIPLCFEGWAKQIRN